MQKFIWLCLVSSFLVHANANVTKIEGDLLQKGFSYNYLTHTRLKIKEHYVSRECSILSHFDGLIYNPHKGIFGDWQPSELKTNIALKNLLIPKISPTEALSRAEIGQAIASQLDVPLSQLLVVDGGGNLLDIYSNAEAPLDFFPKIESYPRSNPCLANYRIYTSKDLDIRLMADAEAKFAEFRVIAEKDHLLFKAKQARKSETTKEVSDLIEGLRVEILRKLQGAIDKPDLYAAYIKQYTLSIDHLKELEIDESDLEKYF